jgi:hypothetical protein
MWTYKNRQAAQNWGQSKKSIDQPSRGPVLLVKLRNLDTLYYTPWLQHFVRY